MSDYVWSVPERRDLSLASRIFAEQTRDGDWVQWASDTLIQDLELHQDPRQGVSTWLFDDEVDLANDLGEHLWGIVQADPFSAAKLVAAEGNALRTMASKLLERMQANGRGMPRTSAIGGSGL